MNVAAMDGNKEEGEEIKTVLHSMGITRISYVEVFEMLRRRNSQRL